MRERKITDGKGGGRYEKGTGEIRMKKEGGI
jgi:hypothetical protein